MKKNKKLLIVLSVCLVSLFATAGIAYAAWTNWGKSAGNKITVGAVENVEVNGNTASINVSFSDPDTTNTGAATLTVKAPAGVKWQLGLGDVDYAAAPASRATNDLYVQMSATDGNFTGAAKVDVKPGSTDVILTGTGTGAAVTYHVLVTIDKTVYHLAGQEITFEIKAEEQPQGGG
jgi:hypothetical protein